MKMINKSNVFNTVTATVLFFAVGVDVVNAQALRRGQAIEVEQADELREQASDIRKEVEVKAVSKTPAAKKPAVTRQHKTSIAKVKVKSSHGEHHEPAPPSFSKGVSVITLNRSLFGPDPDYNGIVYDPAEEFKVYGGKHAVRNPRPLVELGYPQYKEGLLGSSYNWFGAANQLRPQFILYGDARIVATSVNVEIKKGDGAKGFTGVLYDLNLEADLKLTATERFHIGFEPLEDDGKVSRTVIDPFDPKDAAEESEFEKALDPATAFFEGDIGAIISGITGEYTSFDLPVALGLVPLFLHNGIWVEDAFWGGAISIVAKNSKKFDITNYDVTFFVGVDEVTSNAFKKGAGFDQHEASIFGLTAFADYKLGYLEASYAYVDDSDSADGDFSYHNAMVSFTRRYGGKISNSIRVMSNFGQDPGTGFTKTADGYAVLIENSLITSKPSTLIPYFNFFYVVDQVNSLARNTGILKNTGITFEADAETGFRSLDDVAVDAHGGAIGVEYLFNLDQQIVVEVASINGNDSLSPTKEQYGVGLRYQLPLNRQWILRVDGIYADIAGVDDDLSALEVELRVKF